MLLFPGGPGEEGEAEQAGGGDMLAVRTRGQRGRHEDGDAVLLRPALLEVVEGHHLHLLRCYSQVL